MNTLFLNPNTWDCVLDAAGDIALATNPYSLAQDAASSIKTYLGEAYYDTLLGIPYDTLILGKNPSLEFVRGQFIQAAMKVPEVIAARVFFTDFTDRKLSGQVQITDSAHVVTALNF